MSESSLSPFGVFRSKNSLFSLLKRAVKRFRGHTHQPQPAKTGYPTETDQSVESGPDTGLRSRAAAAIQEYAASQATLFERAERLRARSERLEREGTPSDSARNRAERAEQEVATGLADIRAAFGREVDGEKGLAAFDREVESLYPELSAAYPR